MRPVWRQVGAEHLGEVALHGGMHGTGGIKLAHWQVGGRLLAHQDVGAVGGATAGGDNEAEEEAVVRAEGWQLERKGSMCQFTFFVVFFFN